MKAFGWQRMAPDKVPVEFPTEVALHSLYTFVLALIFPEVTGRHGVRQASLLGVLIILTLGSATGDVTFCDDVPLLPVLTVLVALVLLYHNIIWPMGHSKKLEDLLEGRPIMVVEEEQLAWEKLHTESMAKFKFFMGLRVNNVEQLGQARLMTLGTDGQISVFYHPDEEVRAGSFILPTFYTARYTTIPQEGIYAYIRYDAMMAMQAGEKRICSRYANARWPKASRAKRLT